MSATASGAIWHQPHADDPQSNSAALLARLSSGSPHERAAASLFLAQQVETTSGTEAAALGDSLRVLGGVELLARLVSDSRAEVRRAVLMILANLCSDAFDPASALTKCLARDCVEPVVGILRHDEDEVARLYALALLQNVCADSGAAERAVKAGVLPLLSALLEDGDDDSLLCRYAVGCTQNIARAAESRGSNFAEQLAASGGGGAPEARSPPRRSPRFPSAKREVISHCGSPGTPSGHRDTETVPKVGTAGAATATADEQEVLVSQYRWLDAAAEEAETGLGAAGGAADAGGATDSERRSSPRRPSEGGATGRPRGRGSIGSPIWLLAAGGLTLPRASGRLLALGPFAARAPLPTRHPFTPFRVFARRAPVASSQDPAVVYGHARRGSSRPPSSPLLLSSRGLSGLSLGRKPPPPHRSPRVRRCPWHWLGRRERAAQSLAL